MKEKDFQVMFSAWMKDRNPLVSEVFELKICKQNSMPFNQVKEHQLKALSDASSAEGVYHKINDIPKMPGAAHTFANPKPFDCFRIMNAMAYVVIWFYKPRQKKEMIWISIHQFIKEMKTSSRKSLTEERAKEIAYKVFDFNAKVSPTTTNRDTS